MSFPEANLLALKERILRAGLRMNPVLNEEMVRQFERDHRVTLPPDYRWYLLNIGDGGDGPPHYRIKPLVGLNEGCSGADLSSFERRVWLDFEKIQEPFAFTEAWIWESESEVDEARLNQIYQGNLYLGTEGCGQNWVLVVTGPQAGQVWSLCGEGVQPCRPLMTFAQWYTAWLDRDQTSPKCWSWKD